jgi:hypothetical protein
LTVVEATLNYLAALRERPFFLAYAAPEGVATRNTKGDRRIVAIGNARDLAETPSLDREGFTLVRHETPPSDPWDPRTVREQYYPEMEALVGRHTGAAKVVAFDHNVRSRSRAERRENGAQMPVRYAHNDYTEGSGPQRVRDLFPTDEAACLLERRFAVINVWKPIAAPVEESPLAVCDARTIAMDDLVPTDLRYTDRLGEIYSLRFSPAHRWFYFSRMRPDEALLLKCYDSDAARARFTAHSAFEDPTSAPNASLRESIEVRTLAFFPPE